jgi:hypothetical protein
MWLDCRELEFDDFIVPLEAFLQRTVYSYEIVLYLDKRIVGYRKEVDSESSHTRKKVCWVAQHPTVMTSYLEYRRGLILTLGLLRKRMSQRLARETMLMWM